MRSPRPYDPPTSCYAQIFCRNGAQVLQQFCYLDFDTEFEFVDLKNPYNRSFVQIERISTEKRFNEETERRIALGRKKFWTLKNIFKGNFKPKRKCEVFNSYVLPTLLYPAQTWLVSKKDENKLRTTQNSMERAMLNYKITDSIPLSKIKRKLKYNRNIIHCINMLKWDRAGYISRVKDDRWTYKIRNWYIPHKRKKGGQTLKWITNINKFLKYNQYHRIAQDCKE